MTKKVDTWMPLLVDKYLGDTTHLTTEQHGAYLLLLMSMWKKDGRLPGNDVGLAQIAKLSPAKWRSMRSILIDGLLLREEGGFIVQKRLTAELARSKASTEKKSGAGKEGAAKRWGKDSSGNGGSDGNADGTGDGNAIADASQTGWETGASTPPPVPTELPDDAGAPSSRAPAEPHVEPEPGEAERRQAIGEIAAALKRAGLDPMRFNAGDPRALELWRQGATPTEWESLAREAIRKRVGNPWGWVLTVLPSRRAEAATITLAPRPENATAWRDTPEGIDAMAAQLGVQSRGELIGPWRERVYRAWVSSGSPAPTRSAA